MKSKYIVDIINNKSTLKEIGGKAFNLQRLSQLGINIPKSIVLKANAFNDHIRDYKQIEISELKDIITKTSLSKNIKDEINSNITNFRSQIFSIRSSSIHEDGKQNSFAGLFKTFLNVNHEEIEKKIIECWSYYFNLNALKYIGEKTLKEGSMAVIIQEMINSDFSGVSFSKSPDGDKKNIYIEFVEGFGDKLVSGLSTPTSIKIDKSTLNIKHLEKDRNIDHSILKQLGEISNYLEEKLKFPVDIEWTVENGNLIVLQCRPITA